MRNLTFKQQRDKTSISLWRINISNASEWNVEVKGAMKKRLLGILALLGLCLVTIISCDTINVDSPLVESIQVSGSGSAFGEPDVALLNLAISVERDSVNQARDEAAVAMQKVSDSIKDNGVAQQDIQTRNFNIQPQYDYIDKRQVLRGYLVTNTVSIKVRDIKTIGDVIDDSVAAGGDLIRVYSISFNLDDPKELQSQARIKAMKDAYA
ncbi:MAG: SIMPL domain-containing protein, partial [Candidatus Bathyarchaeota archaeon]